MGRPRVDPIKRFWSHVDTSGECWLWVGCRDRDGYGRFHPDNVSRKQMLAHRYSWQLHHATLAPDVLVCHRCDTPACVNPAHLFLGTQIDNQRDKVAKGRQATGARNGAHGHRRGAAISAAMCKLYAAQPEKVVRGSRHGHARLDESAVVSIRNRYATGISQNRLAAEFGVSQATISRAVRGDAWSHVA